MIMVQGEFSDWIGIPFVDGGRDVERDGGLDCYGLLIKVQALFGNDISDVVVSALNSCGIFAVFSAMDARWRPVSQSEQKSGDVVSLAIDPKYPFITQHFGTVIDSQFLHTLKKTGSILTRLDHPFFKNKITGYFRWAT